MVVEVVGGRGGDEEESFLDWDGKATLFEEEAEQDDEEEPLEEDGSDDLD